MKSGRVMVTGAAGQLGSVIVRAFADAEVIAHTRATLDITDGAAVARAVAAARPQLIVNCAAYNDVDGAESAPLVALGVNAFAVRSLSRAAADVGATLVHYSTDFVFDGTADRAYVEDDQPAPQSAYGVSKLLGEWFALECSPAYVLRVESLFGTSREWSGRRGSIDGIVTRIEQGRDVQGFVDRVVSPTYLSDVAAATRHLVAVDAASGVYHCVNRGQATWYDIIAETAQLLGIPPRLTAVTMNEMPLRAKRPMFCALDPGKLARTGFTMPTWKEAVGRWLAARGASET